MKLFDPEGRSILQWNKTFLVCSIIALSVDPLFFYIPNVDGIQKCLDVDHKLEIVVCVLRSFADMLYAVHIIIQFRTAHVSRYDHVHGDRIFRDEPHYVETRYLTSSFIIDVLAALPLPQLVVLVIIPNLDSPAPFLTEKLLMYIIFSQYVTRVIRISIFYKKVTKISGFLTEIAWAGGAFNLFLYVLASHVVGALWYLFGIESELRCWAIACQRHNCDSKYLYCGEGRMGDFGFLNTSCPILQRNEIKDSTNFDFGIFLDALKTRILETRDFPQKFLYCSWWGLQSLSSFGQDLKPSTFYGEILFAHFIAIIALVLFSVLLVNLKKYIQSFSNVSRRVEEMKEKRREAEELMSHIGLPQHLRHRVRRQKHFKWKITRGVELDSFLRGLPRGLRRDINRYLYLPSLMRVPMFKDMGEHLMDAMFERLKPVFYTQNSYILQGGYPVPEILFITRGRVSSFTTDGGRTNLLNYAELGDGDLCGEELLTWPLDPATPTLPFSTRTVKTLTDVEAFSLELADLRFVASQFRPLHSGSLQHNFRFYLEQRRPRAACYIQMVWRRHRRLQAQNRRMQDALSLGSETTSLSFGASIYVAIFSSNALRMLRKNHTHNAQLSTPDLELILPPRPAQPDFENDALPPSSETTCLSFGASICVARFFSNALRLVRKNHTHNAQLSKPDLQLMLHTILQ